MICPSFTFFATAEAVSQRGATPVFCDIDATALNLDPADVADRVTERTKAIAVHLFGRPAALGEPTRRSSRTRRRPSAPSSRARVGGLGVASTFSFFPTKNLFGLGDGGLVASRDAEIADRVRVLRFHGSRDKERFEAIGYNSRLDEFQAAALRLFLGHVDRWNGERREAAARAELGLGELELPEDDPGHVYHMYVVRSPERDRIADALRDAGIGCATYYTTPLHLQPVYVASRRAGEPARDRARRARDDRPSALGGDHGGAAGAGRGHDPLGGRRWSERVRLVSRHRLWQVAADAGLLTLAWYLAFQVRFDKGVPARYDEFLGLDVFGAVVAIKLTSSSSSASTTTGGATSPSGTCGGRS